MRMRSWWIAALLIGTSASAQLAHAQHQAKPKAAGKTGGESVPSDDDEGNDGRHKPISVSLLAGYGHTFNAAEHLNPLAVGFGVRGGYNVGELYIGMRFLFFLGDSEAAADDVETSAKAMTLGLELGYEISLLGDVLFVRPELGAGLMIIEGESMAAGAMPEMSANGSSEDLYIAPGAAMFVNVGKRSFLGLDLQTPIVFTTETKVALTMLAIGGMRF